jgi:replicative DNA helicase
MEQLLLVNMEAEQAVVGALLVEPELIKDCILQPADFYDGRHKNIYWTIRDLDEKNIPIDFISIIERVGQAKVEKIGGVSYLSELAGSIPTTANFSYYQGLVLEYSQKRKQYEIAQTLMQQTLNDDPTISRQEAIDLLGKLDDGGPDQDDGNIKQALVDLYDWMEQEHGDITGAATGFVELDRMLSGMQKQDLIIIGARPSMGKTAFVLNVGLNTMAAPYRNPIGIFSLEMPEQGLLKRMMSNLGNIDAQKMRNPMKDFGDEDWNKSTMAMWQLHNMPLHIFDDPGVDINYIRRKCRMMRKLYPDEHIVVMIDYLQLIVGNPKHGGNRTAEISEISRLLKQIARELDITVIALSQLSRGVEQRQDKRPMMSDLRESGQIEQDADVIGFLYRDDYYDKESENKNIVEIIIAKQRNGPIGTVQLAFVKEYNKFVNLETRYNNKE